MPTTLVTGGAGFIGSHVVDRLLAAGHVVHVVDNLSTGRRRPAGADAHLHVLDVRSSRLDLRSTRLLELFKEVRPGAVVHLAAHADVRRSIADPVFDADVNVLGTLHVLECCRRAGVGHVVFASSGGALYGDRAPVPTPETAPERPASPYGVSKLAAERYIAAWAALTGATAVILRYANVYGPRQYAFGEAGVVAIFAARMASGEPCVITGDGEQTRDFVYVEDVADATVRALGLAEAPGPINIGTGVETSINTLYRRLRAATGRDTAAARYGPAAPGEQRRSALDVALAERALDWAPATPLHVGLVKTLEHFGREMVAR